MYFQRPGNHYGVFKLFEFKISGSISVKNVRYMYMQDFKNGF